MKRAPDPLLAGAAATARRLRVEVDDDAYAVAGRDARQPILYAGKLTARVCIVGRDLGREEVLRGQPLVGSSGRIVRAAVLDAAGEVPSPDDPLLERALCHVLLTNTVPYKPRGNRPFPSPVREAFRPYLECILVCRFRGDRVLALGNEAFDWFARYADDAEVKRIRGPGRFEGDLRCSIVARCHHRAVVRVFRVCPLPHPSPANSRYVRQLPALLARRLHDVQLGK